MQGRKLTGYALNALVDFTDPIEVLQHLLIGSEGTLGFIARITLRTVPEHAHKASALLLFPDVEAAAHAVMALREGPVAAAELMDRASLRSVEGKPGIPPAISGLGEKAAALLVEVRAEDEAQLAAQIATVSALLSGKDLLAPPAFERDPKITEAYWKVRKGTFPAVGAMRRTGTTVLIEDVAFPIESLADATLDLQQLLRHHGYHEGIIFGHALEGNLHFVITQDFGDQAEIDRYARFMDDLCDMVVRKYDGSLKAEHGTGRNMAPFVEMEWGKEATDLMRRIKALFDPEGLLNPGVIINDNPHAHLENLKPMPAAEDIVDRCIECGFCEPLCPSHRLTLSPRQRITSVRELARRAAAGEHAGQMTEDYAYMGLDTCAGCGLCSTACPVGIDTGDLTRRLRGRQLGDKARALHNWTGENFGTFAGLSRTGLKVGHAVAGVLGDKFVNRVSGGAWRNNMPSAGRPPVQRAAQGDPVVYFPTCGARIFGPANHTDPQLGDVVQELLIRAGFRPILPEGFDKLCCGQMLASKGMQQEAEDMSNTLEAALLKASDNGRIPVIMDASACTTRMQKHLAGRLKLYDFHEFAHDALLPRLMITRQPGPVALHVNCSVKRTGADSKLKALVTACVEQVVEPASTTCCGFAGDRGFLVPELNQHALRNIHAELQEKAPAGCACGVSTNRTCEIGLTAETGITYRSVAYLLEACSRREETITC